MLPKPVRLRSRSDFDSVFKEGRVLIRPAVRVVHREGAGRIAIVVSRAIGSVAKRNAVRRRWREALRGLLDCAPKNRDVVMVVKADGAELRGSALKQELEGALASLAR